MPAAGESNSHQVKPDVLKAVIDAYYPDAIGGAAQVRARAATAQSAASVVVGIFVGVVSWSSFNELPTFLRLGAILNVMAWSATAILYVIAVSSPASGRLRTNRRTTEDELVRLILDAAWTEREAIDRRLRWANRVFYAALLITSISVGYTIIHPDQAQWRSFTLAPSSAERSALRTVCPQLPEVVVGTIDTTRLSDTMLDIKLDCADEHLKIGMANSTLESMVIIGGE